MLRFKIYQLASVKYLLNFIKIENSVNQFNKVVLCIVDKITNL